MAVRSSPCYLLCKAISITISSISGSYTLNLLSPFLTTISRILCIIGTSTFLKQNYIVSDYFYKQEQSKNCI